MRSPRTAFVRAPTLSPRRLALTPHTNLYLRAQLHAGRRPTFCQTRCYRVYSSRAFFSPSFAAVFGLGASAIAFGIYEFYNNTLHMWPPQVRPDLKAGLFAKLNGDLVQSAKHLRAAWNTARVMSPVAFAPQPFLKTSGIAIALATVLESAGLVEEAFDVYVQSLDLIPPPDADIDIVSVPTDAEQLRSVAISYRLAELAHALNKPLEEEERWLVRPVHVLLKHIMRAHPTAAPDADVSFSTDLQLPKWVSKHDLAAPFEALASFYAQHHNTARAMPLYLQAISILIPPPPQHSSVEDRCRGAQLMGNVSELVMKASPAPETLAQAESWARKGLAIVLRARKDSLVMHPVCEIAYAVALFNVGVVADMLGEKITARTLLEQSLEQSRKIGMLEGIDHAQEALAKVKLDTVMDENLVAQ